MSTIKLPGTHLCTPQLFSVQLSKINSYLEVIDVLPYLCAVQLSTINSYLGLIDVLPPAVCCTTVHNK